MKKDETIKKLKNEFDENINSHIFLVETDNVEDCLFDIKDVIKHIIAKNDDITAHQIDEETYLEMTIIRPNGKDIKKDQIKELQDRIKTKPMLSDYMFYVIVDAETINDIAANKLLKTIEEPNANTIGFMISTNIDVMLPTIKSRCELLTLFYNDTASEKISPEILELTDKLVMAIEKEDHISFYKIKMEEKEFKENHKLVENLIKDYYNTACNFKTKRQLNGNIVDFIKKNNSYTRLVKKAWYLNKTLNKLINNMNGDLLLEKIYLDFKGVK